MFKVYKEVLQNHYVDFYGRISRKQFWLYVASNFIISLGISIISALIFNSNIIASIYSLAVILPSIGACIRRLHDTGRSGWWYLLALTGIGAIVVIVLFCLPGDKDNNIFGAATNEPDNITSESVITADDQNNKDDVETLLVAVDEEDDMTRAIEEVELSEHEPESYLVRLSDNVRIDMRGWEYSIGKSPSHADYVVSNDKTVSRRHAIIFVTNEGYYIRDNESKNYTYLNNVKIIPAKDYELHDGDLVRLSNIEFIFHSI